METKQRIGNEVIDRIGVQIWCSFCFHFPVSRFPLPVAHCPLPVARFSNILVFCCRFTAKHRRLCKTIYGKRQLWRWEAEPYSRWCERQTCRVSLAGRHHIYEWLWAYRDLLRWFFDRPKVGSVSCSLLPKAGVI